MALSEGWLGLGHGIEAIGSPVDIRKLVMGLTHVAIPSIVESKVIGNATLIAIEVVHLFTLQLVLNALAIGCIANQGKYGTNALDEERTLGRFRVIKSRLTMTLMD